MTITFGDVVRRGDVFDLSFRRIYATSPEDVWSAVTERDRLARWMARYEGDLRLGGRWDALEDDGSVFCSGTVTECEPPRRYVTTWEYEGEPASTVTVEILEHPEGAELVLRHDGIAAIGYAAGWQTYLEQLDDSLRPAPSSPVDPERRTGIAWGDRYAQLDPVWRRRLEG